MKTAYNHLTHSYETPDKTTVAAEICEGDSPSDAFCAAAIREQQRKSAAYALTVIDALYENSDPVSIDAAELLERLSKAQPQQDPVAWINWCAATGKRSVSFECESELASQPLYEGITQNTQYHYSKFHSWFDSELHRQKYTKDHPAYLAAQEAWNAANDAAQHRINHLNAEIEAWKVRFKIAEDALAKLNGQEQKPVAWVGSLKDPQPHCVTDLKYCSAAQWDTGYHLKYIPLYTSPPASKPWVGLTEDERNAIGRHHAYVDNIIRATEAKLREKNT